MKEGRKLNKGIFIAEISYLRGMLSGTAIVNTMLTESLSFDEVCGRMIESVDKIGTTVQGDEYTDIINSPDA